MENSFSEKNSKNQKCLLQMINEKFDIWYEMAPNT